MKVLEVLDFDERIYVQIDVSGELPQTVQDMKERLKASVDKRSFLIRERDIKPS